MDLFQNNSHSTAQWPLLSPPEKMEPSPAACRTSLQLHMTMDLRNTQIFESPTSSLDLFFRNFTSLFDFFFSFTPLALKIDTFHKTLLLLCCNFSWEVCPEVHYLEIHYSRSYHGPEPTSKPQINPFRQLPAPKTTPYSTISPKLSFLQRCRKKSERSFAQRSDPP